MAYLPEERETIVRYDELENSWYLESNVRKHITKILKTEEVFESVDKELENDRVVSVLIFENPYGDCVKIDGYFWSWGDYFELEIDNFLNFSDWLSKQDVDWNMLEEDGYEYLADLVYWYREENEND